MAQSAGKLEASSLILRVTFLGVGWVVGWVVVSVATLDKEWYLRLR